MGIVKDCLGDTNVEIDRGVVSRLTRKWILDPEEAPIVEGKAGTFRLLEVLAHEEVPRFGSVPEDYPGLQLVRHHITNDERTGLFLLTCDYVRAGEANISFKFSGRGSLSAVQSEKDAYGNQIVVAHTWPGTDPDFPGVTQYQGGEISVMLPVTSLNCAGLLQTDSPLMWQNLLLGAVNAFPWASRPAGTWLVTDCSFDPHDLPDRSDFANLYEFRFELTHNFAQWQPYVWFVDERTGKPAPNLVPNVGVRQVPWYPAVDFHAFFSDK
jgi:hypothetical protein